jgi:hypothetical protein
VAVYVYLFDGEGQLGKSMIASARYCFSVVHGLKVECSRGEDLQRKHNGHWCVSY